MTRARLLALLNASIPAVFVEGGAGTHKRALLQAWGEQESAQLRVLVEFDVRQLTPEVMANRLAYQLELAGVKATQSGEVGSGWDGLSQQLGRAVEALSQPLALGVHWMDELPPAATRVLIQAAGSLPGFRLVSTAVDADLLTAQAIEVGIGHRVVSDSDLGYTTDEVAELMTRGSAEVTEATVRAILEATGGVPALVERAISLFGHECQAGTISEEQAVSGWMPDRHGGTLFRRQLRELAQAPRFSYEFLECLYGTERSDYLFARLSRLGVGFASQPLSGRRMFTWRQALRRHLLEFWHGDARVEELAEDRTRVASCALATSDPELALATLVANHALDDAEQLCARWLWELLDADPGLLWGYFVTLDPQELRDYPNLLVAATLVQPVRGEASADPELASVQQELLAAPIRGKLPTQLGQLARAATLALAIGEVGIATRAAVRWANLATAEAESWSGRVGAGAVSDGLLIIRALMQLDRMDLVPRLAQMLLSVTRRGQGRDSAEGRARMGLLLWALQLALTFQGSPRAEIRSLTLAPRQYHREFGVAIYATLDACEALDRADLASAEAFTRVAMFRLPHPCDWPALVFLRAVALIGLGDRGQLDELADLTLTNQRWAAWQHHPEAPGMFAAVTESLVAGVTQRLQRSPVEVGAEVRALPPGALHRWPSWGRRIFEMGPQASASARVPVVPADAELAGWTPRVRWYVCLVAALANLRSGEEATAVSVILRGGARLKYPAAPLPLVLASKAEIQLLNDRLPAGASPMVRASLALANAYAGVEAEAKGGVRLAARELEVLNGVRRGLTNTAIAGELFVSVNTVKFHRANLYRKLNATSRAELLAEALQQGL